MRTLSRIIIAAAVLSLLFGGAASFAVGCLKINSSNPHYFQEDGTGRPIVIASVMAIVPNWTGWDDVVGQQQTIYRNRLPWARNWHMGAYCDSQSIQAYAFTAQTGSCYAVPYKWDMNTWNATYWTRLADSISRANNAGVYSETLVFERCWMSPPDPCRWGGNPWANQNNINNINNINVADCWADGTPGFYNWSGNSNLKYHQERWVKKLIDTTIQYPNVIYEVENEHWASNSAGWADHYGQFIKDYISSTYPSYPRLTSYSSIISDADLDQCFNWSCIDIVNRHYGSDLSTVTDYIEVRWNYNKPINIDEFANGENNQTELRQSCWRIICSGGHYHIEDAYDVARPVLVCNNIRSFIALSGWNFINAHPHSSLISGGSAMGACMENSGVEYVCYFPTGGNKTVNIAAGNYREEWWNPKTGGFYNITNYTHNGGNRSFSCPDGNDWVLHVTTAAAPTTVLNSKYASSSLTIDGDTGLVGFDSDLVCYVGGYSDSYSSGGQILPTGESDHTARIYSRNDGSYLYLLIRCSDDDMRYSNPTSDAQLVIDANNQKNVYMTTSGYATTILNGVTSAVVRDVSGWWLEVRLSKSAFSPSIPSTGTIGIDFNFRDNDNNNDTTLTTCTTWHEPELSTSFPTKIPNRWGDLSLLGSGGGDTTPPAAVSSFAATSGTAQVSLTWHNPSDSDFTGTMIRYKTTGYPTSTTDGTLVVDKAASPNTNDASTHTGLTGGVTYYYSAFSHDGIPNYASAANANATPTTPSVSWNTVPISTIGWATQVCSSAPPSRSRPARAPATTTLRISCWTVTTFRTLCGKKTGVATATRSGTPTASAATGTRPRSWWHTTMTKATERAKCPRLDVFGNNVVVSIYGVPNEDQPGTEGTYVTYTYDSSGNASEIGRRQNEFVCPWAVFDTGATVHTVGRRGSLGTWEKRYTTNLNTCYGMWNLSTMYEWDAENRGVYMDRSANTIHGVGITGGGNDNLCIWYNNSMRAANAQNSIYGLAAAQGEYWSCGCVWPQVAMDAGGKVYIAIRRAETGEGWATIISGEAFATPVVFASGVTGYLHYGPVIVPAGSGGGVYAAWDYGGQVYVTSIGAGSISGPATQTINVKSASNMNIVIDGSSSDWTLGDFTTKTRGGQGETGDYAIVGYDGATYYAGRCDLTTPTSATDFTAKVYSRHDSQYQYFLVRCDDSQMNYANPTSANWANDCIELYIDPGHDHGSSSINNSTSDLQLVIDCNNQKNVYMVTGGYTSQVLAGVTSSVVRDGTGWWLEVRILKSAIDPDLPASGTFGVDFCFRDNDNPDATYYYGNPNASTMYSWRDNPSGGSFPTKVPDKWGNASLATLASDTTAPAAVTSFTATGGSQQVSLSWTNPTTADWAGTMIRCNTTGYPTSPTDGALVYSGTSTSCTHTGLTQGGITYYYSTYAYDEVPNYASAAQASGTPVGATISVKDASNLNLVIDAGSSDWSLADFTTKSRGGQNSAGDYALAQLRHFGSGFDLKTGVLRGCFVTIFYQGKLPIATMIVSWLARQLDAECG